MKKKDEEETVDDNYQERTKKNKIVNRLGVRISPDQTLKKIKLNLFFTRVVFKVKYFFFFTNHHLKKSSKLSLVYSQF